jgi:hypothetical protein
MAIVMALLSDTGGSVISTFQGSQMPKFALALLIAGTGTLPLVIGEVQSHGEGNTLASTGFIILVVGVVIPLFIRAVRGLRKFLRTVMDCIWVARRGVLNPIQVRQEFIETMGREPTIAEVHDLYAMIRSEYNQAILTLGGIVAAGYIFDRGVKGKGLF